MIAQQKAPTVTSGSGLRKTHHSNSSEAQRRRLLVRLRVGPLSTIEARRDLDIMMPAARVFELRALGHRIDTFRTHEPTECGKTHCVARYALQSSDLTPTQHLEVSNDCGRPREAQCAQDGG